MINFWPLSHTGLQLFPLTSLPFFPHVSPTILGQKSPVFFVRFGGNLLMFLVNS